MTGGVVAEGRWWGGDEEGDAVLEGRLVLFLGCADQGLEDVARARNDAGRALARGMEVGDGHAPDAEHLLVGAVLLPAPHAEPMSAEVYRELRLEGRLEHDLERERVVFAGGAVAHGDALALARAPPFRLL